MVLVVSQSEFVSLCRVYRSLLYFRPFILFYQDVPIIYPVSTEHFLLLVYLKAGKLGVNADSIILPCYFSCLR